MAELPATADVVVIGAGLVGCATAAALSHAGLRVCLIERAGLVGGTTASGEGNILVSDKMPGPELALAMRSNELWREFGREHEVEFEEKGGLVVAWTDAEWTALRSLAREQERHGVTIELVDAVREVEPLLADGLRGGIRYPQDAQVLPMAAAAAYLRSADITFLTRTAVTGCVVARGGLTAIRTSRGEVSTPAAVVAAGPWSGEVARLLGTQAPIRPRRGDILVTEPVHRLMRHKVYEADYVSTITGGGPAFSTVVEGTASGTVLIGSSRAFVGFDATAQPAKMAELARRAIRLFPVLNTVRAMRTYHGFRPASPDSAPLIGPDPLIDGVFLATGHEGAGIGLAPVTAELITAQITGSAPPVDPAPFAPARFVRQAA